MRSTRSTSSCIMISMCTSCCCFCVAYLESPSGLERKWRDLLATLTPDVDGKHVLSAFIKHLYNGKRMLLQCRVGELVYSIVGFIASVIDCLRDVLDVIVDLLLIPRSRFGVCTDEVN